MVPYPHLSQKNAQKEVQFNLKHIILTVPCGQLVAIVGAVGSGKTSFLQGTILYSHTRTTNTEKYFIYLSEKVCLLNYSHTLTCIRPDNLPGD